MSGPASQGQAGAASEVTTEAGDLGLIKGMVESVAEETGTPPADGQDSLTFAREGKGSN